MQRLFKPLFNWIARLLRIRRDPSLTWPTGLELVGRECYENALGLVELLIAKIREEWDCVIRVVEAEKLINGLFVFRHQLVPGCWIGGYCRTVGRSAAEIFVGHARGNPLIINIGTLIHELCHLILFAMSIFGHDPRLDGHVDGWRVSRDITGVVYAAHRMGAGSYCIDIDTTLADGTPAHYHFDHVFPDNIKTLAALRDGRLPDPLEGIA